MSDQINDLETIAEKAKYEYCLEVFQLENSRRESLERKSQFLLAIITLILGALLLNVEIWNVIDDLLKIKGYNTFQSYLTYGLLIFIGIGLITSLLGSLLSMNVRYYSDGFPISPLRKMFSPSTEHYEENIAKEIFRVNAIMLTIAIINNTDINIRKGRWINFSTWALFLAILSLGIFLLNLIYLFS